MIKHPSCSSCLDGEIAVTVEGPIRNYQFRIEGPGIANPDQWYFADNFGGRTKTFKGLGVGRYVIEVDVDDEVCTQSCVRVVEVELLDPCPAPDNPDCNCEYALQLDNNSSASTVSGASTAPNRMVRFLNRNPKTGVAPFTPYTTGSSYALEAWIKLPPRGAFDRDSLVIFGRSNNDPGAVHWSDLPSYGAGGRYHFYTNWRVQWRTTAISGQPETGWFLVYSAGVSKNLLTGVTPAVPVDSTTHAVSRLLYMTPLPAGELFHLVVNVWRHEILNPGAANQQVFFEAFVNGQLLPVPNSYPFTAPSWDSVLSDLPSYAAQVAFINNLANHVGAIYLGPQEMNFGSNTSPFYNKGNGVVVTNFKMYNRRLTVAEVHHSYLQGCRGEGIDCDNLVLWAPLNQAEGSVTPERRYGNHGELVNFPSSVLSKGGAWLRECCGRISETALIDCPKSDCIPDAALFRFRFLQGFLEATTNLFVGFLLYDPGQLVGFTAGDILRDIDIAFGVAASTTPEEAVARLSEAFVAAFNSHPYWGSQVGASASYTDGYIEVAVPFSYEYGILPERWCNKMLRIELGVFVPSATNPRERVVRAVFSNAEYVGWPDCDYIRCCLPTCTDAHTFQVKI